MHPLSSKFIATLFMIAKTWKQSKCPATDEWIRKMWSIYTMEYYPAIKRNEIMSFMAALIQLDFIILNEVTRNRKTYIHLYVEYKIWCK